MAVCCLDIWWMPLKIQEHVFCTAFQCEPECDKLWTIQKHRNDDRNKDDRRRFSYEKL